MGGWIKLHRCLLNNPVVMRDSDYMSVWVWLLLRASRQDYPKLFGNKKIILKPGQLVTGRIEISETLHINQSKVYRILKWFESEHQLEMEVNNKGSLITIVNWELYQGGDDDSEQQMNNKRTSNEQQMNTIQEYKNNKNNNNANSGVRVQLEESFEDLYQRYRSLTNSSNGKGDAKKIYIDYCTKGYKGTKLNPEQIEEYFANYIQENQDQKEREGWSPRLKNIDTLMRHVTDYKGDANDNG